MPHLSVDTHCLCLAYNSLWLLEPAILATYHRMQTLAFMTTLACVFSVMHWSFHKPYRLWFWLDVACANVTIAYYLTHAPPQVFYNQLLCLAIASVFFAHACWHPLGSYRGLGAHLCFRYFCYCGMMAMYMDCTTVSFVLHSILYVLSIVHSV